jgi:hypothetical protein
MTPTVQQSKRLLVLLLMATGVLTSCASPAPRSSVTAAVAVPSIGAVQSRNQFVVCVGCELAPTPKTLATAATTVAMVPSSQTTLLQPTALPPSKIQSAQAPVKLAQVFESGVHPTDLLIRFERGSAALPTSASADLANLRPALSVPHVLHLVASTDGIGSRRINRQLADARTQAVLTALNNAIVAVPAETSKRKQLKITTSPATVRGLNPDLRTVLIQVEIL